MPINNLYLKILPTINVIRLLLFYTNYTWFIYICQLARIVHTYTYVHVPLFYSETITIFLINSFSVYYVDLLVSCIKPVLRNFSFKPAAHIELVYISVGVVDIKWFIN